MPDDSQRDRAEAIAAHSAALNRQREAEIARAQQLIDEFVASMNELGIPPARLRARVPGRRSTYRTGRTGWYIRQNRSLAIGTGGEFLILDVPARVKSLVFGATVTPVDPPLVVGRGARDGESIELAELLRRAVSQD